LPVQISPQLRAGPKRSVARNDVALRAHQGAQGTLPGGSGTVPGPRGSRAAAKCANESQSAARASQEACSCPGRANRGDFHRGNIPLDETPVSPRPRPSVSPLIGRPWVPNTEGHLRQFPAAIPQGRRPATACPRPTGLPGSGPRARRTGRSDKTYRVNRRGASTDQPRRPGTRPIGSQALGRPGGHPMDYRTHP
jgi:hypothetical protein